MLADTPATPYYAVIFSSVRTDIETGYEGMSDLMVALARDQPGFLGVESARNEIGITVSYWKDLESIKNWKENAKHQVAQARGKNEWYKHYTMRIAQVEHEYRFNKN